jgi:tetratricopeptide (TPR) repeat protein
MAAATVFRRVPILLALCSLTAALVPVRTMAQVPQQFENLKHFRRDIPRDSLVTAMRDIATALGVRCWYCHAGGDSITLQGVNFASDSLLTKRKARQMLAMVDQINNNLLSQVEGRVQPAVRVSCVTCHRTVAVPKTLQQRLTETVATSGAPAAAALYRQLRTTEMVRGRYDFGEASLNEVGRNLAVAGNVDAAIVLYELNAEFYPNSAQVLQALGDLYRRKSNNAKALEYYDRLLVIQPNNRQLQDLIRQLRGGGGASYRHPGS